MATWPATLPQSFLQRGLEIEYADNRIRSENDVGPAKVRKRSSLNVGLLRGSMVMNCEQKTTLDTFISTTLGGGILAFDFPSLTGGTISVRFGASLPRAGFISPNLYGVTMEMEILP